MSGQVIWVWAKEPIFSADNDAEEHLQEPPEHGGGDGEPPPPPPRDPSLKFRAKRINEHVKSVYSVANTLGAAIIGAAFIIPAVTKGPNGPDLDAPGWCLIGLVLILGGHAAIWRFMRSEE